MKFIVTLIGILLCQAASAQTGVSSDPNSPPVSTANGATLGTTAGGQPLDPSQVQTVQAAPVVVQNGQVQPTSSNQQFGTGQPTSVNQPLGTVQPTSSNQPSPINIQGPVPPLNQPAGAVGSNQANVVSNELQNLLQLSDTTRDTLKTCVISKDVTNKVTTAYVGRAQNMANQISADPVLTAQQKTNLKNSLNTFATTMVAQVNSNYAALAASKYGQSLTQNFNDLLKIVPDTVILNYLAGIKAKMNEQIAVCNNLNANYYAKSLNDYNTNLNKVLAAFKKLNPQAGTSSTSGVVGAPPLQ